MDQSNTDLFIQKRLNIQTSKCDSVLRHLVTHRGQAQQMRPSTGKPVLRLRWEIITGQTVNPTLLARWKVE